MNFQTSRKKTGICLAITSLVYYVPDTIFPSCQQLAIIGFCEFCSIPSQEKQKKPLLDNKLSTSWPLLSPHLWQSPLAINKLASPRFGSKGLEKKQLGFGGSQPCNHQLTSSMLGQWCLKKTHQTQTLLPNWWGEKYEFMKMNKGGGETQWKSWASPGTSSIKVCTSVFPPNGLISLSQKVPVPFHGSKGMCNNKSWLEGKL